jgi:hypothetical protein
MPILASQFGEPFRCVISRPAAMKRALLPSTFVVCSRSLFAFQRAQAFAAPWGLSLTANAKPPSDWL